MADTTIFVVDDDEAVRDSLCGLLNIHGYKSRTFSCAKEFLEAGLDHASGCAVVDIQMPGMSGIEMHTELKHRGATIPVIILTSHGDVPKAVAALKAGAVDFIEKPFDVPILLKAVKNAVSLNEQERKHAHSNEDFSQRLAFLTKREREVLDLMVAGAPNKAVAVKLGISVRTAEFYRAKVLEKMGSSSLPGLIHLVIRHSSSLH